MTLNKWQSFWFVAAIFFYGWSLVEFISVMGHIISAEFLDDIRFANLLLMLSGMSLVIIVRDLKNEQKHLKIIRALWYVSGVGFCIAVCALAYYSIKVAAFEEFSQEEIVSQIIALLAAIANIALWIYIRVQTTKVIRASINI